MGHLMIQVIQQNVRQHLMDGVEFQQQQALIHQELMEGRGILCLLVFHMAFKVLIIV